MTGRTETVSERCDRIRREVAQKQRESRDAWHRQPVGVKVNEVAGWIQEFISESPDSLTYGDVWFLEDIARFVRELARGEFICTQCYLRKDSEKGEDDDIAF